MHRFRAIASAHHLTTPAGGGAGVAPPLRHLTLFKRTLIIQTAAEPVRIERLTGADSGILELQLNRPEVKNAINTGLLKGLQDAIKVIAGDASARVVLVSSAVRGLFCSGADLKVLKRCIDSNLMLSWEKSHFMVQQGIVLGHVVSNRGVEVDKAKVEVIYALTPPTTVKQIRAFLGHAGFYHRFIKDFSKIAKPLTALLIKDVVFDFNDACLTAFDLLKHALSIAPIVTTPDWDLPFELMCDASDFAIGAVLGQTKDKRHHVIYYSSKTLADAALNYTTTEKEFLAVVYALDKFRPYIVG